MKSAAGKVGVRPTAKCSESESTPLHAMVCLQIEILASCLKQLKT